MDPKSARLWFKEYIGRWLWCVCSRQCHFGLVANIKRHCAPIIYHHQFDAYRNFIITQCCDEHGRKEKRKKRQSTGLQCFVITEHLLKTEGIETPNQIGKTPPTHTLFLSMDGYDWGSVFNNVPNRRARRAFHRAPRIPGAGFFFLRWHLICWYMWEHFICAGWTCPSQKSYITWNTIGRWYLHTNLIWRCLGPWNYSDLFVNG